MKETNYENRNSDLMNAEIYNALRSAGVADEAAEKAAKASAKNSMQYIQLNQKIDSSVGELNQKIDVSVGELKHDIGNLDHKVDNSVAELKHGIENLDHKVDSSVERLDQKIDNKSNTTHALLIGLVVVVVAQIITQYFF